MSHVPAILERPVAILAGQRTPFAKAFTKLNQVPADQLGIASLRATLEQASIRNDQIDQVIFGNVCGQSDAANIARVIALKAGIPQDRIAHTVNRNCASGMESLIQASQLIQLHQADVLIAGGTESMSQVPFLFSEPAKSWFSALQKAKTIGQKFSLLTQFRPGMLKPIPQLQLGLTDPTCGLSMGQTAEILAKEFKISREAQDEFALSSHQRALAAAEQGFFKNEMSSFSFDESGNHLLTEDVGPRAGQSMESLAKLKPIFDRQSGSITVGNSCPITDGAVSLLVTPADHELAQTQKPLGYLRAYAISGCDPSRMGLGPVFAIDQLLKGTGKSLDDFELIEINEAFAAQVLSCVEAMNSEEFCSEQLGRDQPIGLIDQEKLNIHGGAIALGHPVGATGARLVLTLLQSLQVTGKRQGIASLCVGGGQGVAMWLSTDLD